jgi:hypothetical protein
MKKNMGQADRLLRVAAAVAIAIGYFTGILGGLTATLLGIVAVVFLATSAAGFCPLYFPLGLNTLRRRKETA